MYKLFLTLRYLTRKKIVIFPILVVWLCLMMMIIVTSIMGGFVDRVRDTNRDLMGDIVISNDASQGWPYYTELSDLLRKKFPTDIAEITPVVRGYGLLNLPEYNLTFFVQVNGIDPVQRSRVSRFQPTLYHQYIAPHDAIDDLTPALPATTEKLRRFASERLQHAQDLYIKAQEHLADILPAGAAPGDPIPETGRPNWWWLCGIPVVLVLTWLRLRRRSLRPRTIFDWLSGITLLTVGMVILTLGLLWPVLFPRTFSLAEDAEHQSLLDFNRAWETSRYAIKLPDNATWNTPADLVAALVPAHPSFDLPPQVAAEALKENDDPDYTAVGCIVGAQTPLFNRDKRGNFNRSFDTGDLKARITIVPILKAGSISTEPPSNRTFYIVDDSYSGVYDVDSTYVYAPFDRVQLMAGMRSDAPFGNPKWFEPRCSDLLIKLKGNPSEDTTRRIRSLINDTIADFVASHPEVRFGDSLAAETWDEKQAKYLGAVENEKHMITFILGLMSLVVLVVVFLIFYMIVREKTRDIGIIKAVGGSEWGVAQIFLIYGFSVALVGGILGLISGVEFVIHTNQIHEWIYRTTGLIIWDRSVYLFDKIPDQVHPWEVALYFGLSLLAGVLGATIPALVAAAEDPVKAVRYE